MEKVKTEFEKEAENIAKNPSISIKKEELFGLAVKNAMEIGEQKLTYSQFVGRLSQYPNILLFAKGIQDNKMLIPLFRYSSTKIIADWNKPEARIKIPIRSAQCTHADVFDFDAFFDELIEGRTECPICGQRLSFSTLYVDHQIWSIIKRSEAPKKDPVILVGIKTSTGAATLERELYEYSERDIISNNLEKPKAAAFTMRDVSPGSKRTKIGSSNDFFVLQSLTYDRERNLSYFNILNGKESLFKSDPAFVLHLFFVDQKNQLQMIQDILKSKPIENDDKIAVDLFYMFGSGALREAVITRDLITTLIGAFISSEVVIYLDDSKKAIAKQYLVTLCDFLARKREAKITICHCSGSKEVDEELTEVCRLAKVEIKKYNKDTLDVIKKGVLNRAPKGQPSTFIDVVLQKLNANARELEKMFKYLGERGKEGGLLKGIFWKHEKFDGIHDKFTLQAPKKDTKIIINPLVLDFSADVVIMQESEKTAKLLVSYRGMEKMQKKHSFVLSHPKAKKLIHRYLECKNKVLIYADVPEDADDQIPLSISLANYLAEFVVTLQNSAKGGAMEAFYNEIKTKGKAAYSSKLNISLEYGETDSKNPEAVRGGDWEAVMDSAKYTLTVRSAKLTTAFTEYMSKNQPYEADEDVMTTTFENYLMKKFKDFLKGSKWARSNFEIYEEQRDSFYGILYTINII